MIDPVIHGLSNEAYHHEAPYSEYLSSSQLKVYSRSPKVAKFALDNPTEEKSDALRFGSLFHDLMACSAEHYDNGTEAIAQWLRGIAVFKPPKNDKTGQPYGTTTKAYITAYEAFLQANEGKLIATDEGLSLAQKMCQSLLVDCGATSEQVRKALRYGKPEVSHFIEYEGCKFKFRPDLTTRYRRKGRQCADLYDWKSVATDDLSEESINRIILKYGYHISASHYQFFYHEQTGIWPGFILVLVSKVAPHDCVMVDMCNYGYRYYPDVDIVSMGPGAMEFKKLLDLHIKCTKENHWPGAEQAIPDNNGVRILEIQPPRYYQSKFIEEI
jgi:hypothetical protein